jgi:predicted AAA+ superfamily ATPase
MWVSSGREYGLCSSVTRRIDDIETVRKEAVAWQDMRNNKNARVNWQFTTTDARVKLSRLYPTLKS